MKNPNRHDLSPNKKWRSFTRWVDLDTGEVIAKENQHLYYVIKTSKYVYQLKRTESARIVEYTKQCKRRTADQLEIFATNNT